MKILFDGDSLAYGFRPDGQKTDITYPEVIAKRLHAEVRNIAVPGYSYTARTIYDTQCLSGRVMNEQIFYEGYDLICLAAGANDYGHDYPLGTIDDNSITTFAGSVQYLIQKIKKQTNSKILIITPQYRGRYQDIFANCMKYKNKCGCTLTDYEQMLLLIAQREQVPIYHASKIGIVNEDNIKDATYDGLHPYSLYYDKIGNSIATFIEQELSF